ncbi:hypothetical protein L1049_001053 [Liquidambar formosana]|uniref:DUF7705 domain-containing protein n=1 Tax=Liquidambar formosana TaxID=63359 RepID=A0AAP0N9W7_LIQFO
MESSTVEEKELWRFSCFILLVPLFGLIVSAGEDYISAVGDPGMRRDGLRVAIEAWNQCNEVGEEVPYMGSPRMADCFDVDYSSVSCKQIMPIVIMQDPGTIPVERHWPSIDLGTEIFISSDEVAEWTVSNFDIIVPREDDYHTGNPTKPPNLECFLHFGD